MAISVTHLQPGDVVQSAQPIFNDGSFPDLEDNALLVSAGRRGVVINVGYLEADPDRQIFLVRFEMEGTGELGPGIGCWEEDLEVTS